MKEIDTYQVQFAWNLLELNQPVHAVSLAPVVSFVVESHAVCMAWHQRSYL